jgi:hypothetical protein
MEVPVLTAAVPYTPLIEKLIQGKMEEERKQIQGWFFCTVFRETRYEMSTHDDHGGGR